MLMNEPVLHVESKVDPDEKIVVLLEKGMFGAGLLCFRACRSVDSSPRSLFPRNVFISFQLRIMRPGHISLSVSPLLMLLCFQSKPAQTTLRYH